MNPFVRVGKITIGAVLFLILVGGIVRSTGSGMGCPDWPKCFGMIVPPTSEAQLPADYQTIYKDHGYGEAKFNVAKTWTEYINRLIGVVIGLLVFVTMILSFRFWKFDKLIVLAGVGGFLLTGFQGWLGAKVVDSNLDEFKITIHMLMALVILVVLVAGVIKADKWKETIETANKGPLLPSWMTWLTAGLLITLTVQILIGTQVRQNVDMVADSLGFDHRSEWVAALGAIFDLHQVFFLVPTGLAIALAWFIHKHTDKGNSFRTQAMVLLAFLFTEVLAGAILGGMDIPAWTQPIHLFLASILFTINIWMLNGMMLQGISLGSKYSSKNHSMPQEAIA